MMLYIRTEDLDSSRYGPEALRSLRRRRFLRGMLAPGQLHVSSEGKMLLGLGVLVRRVILTTVTLPEYLFGE